MDKLGLMNVAHRQSRVPDRLTSYFWSADAIRSRSVSEVVFSSTVEIPVPPARLTADWERETNGRLGLEPGDVEALSLARARARWPDYKHCVQAVSDWTRALGLQEVLASSDVALMTCRGAKYHHDGAHYGGMAFCNLFLSEDKGLDLHFPNTGHRIPLSRGTAVFFDTGQPHAVIERGNGNGGGGCDANLGGLPSGTDCTQIFLTWEVPLEDINVSKALHIEFDTDPLTAPPLEEEQVWLNGAPATLCPDTGRWLQPSRPSDRATYFDRMPASTLAVP